MVIGKVLLQNIDVSALSFQNYVLCNRIPYFLRTQNTDQLDVFVRIAFVFWNKCCDVVIERSLIQILNENINKICHHIQFP